MRVTGREFWHKYLVDDWQYGIIFPLFTSIDRLQTVKKYFALLKGYQLVLQISSIFVCAVLGALLGGIWLDRSFGTAPCLMLLLMILGIAFAMYAVYRTVNQE